MTEVTKIDPSAIAEVNPMISMIERVAMDPSADIDKLERMLQLKERLDSTAAETSFNVALAKAQAEMPSVIARHDNAQTRSKYADLKDIYEVCKPVAAAHGFSFNAIPVSGGRDGYINMRWTLRRGAHSETDISEVPIDDKGMKGAPNKTGTHAYGSTSSYGRRYLFCAVFDIAVGDDTDGNKPQEKVETVSAEQFMELRDLIEKSTVTLLTFNKAFGHQNPETGMLEEFPASLFAEAKTRLEKNIKAKESSNG